MRLVLLVVLIAAVVTFDSAETSSRLDFAQDGGAAAQ